VVRCVRLGVALGGLGGQRVWQSKHCFISCLLSWPVKQKNATGGKYLDPRRFPVQQSASRVSGSTS
jgi:hypothetical protein